MGAADMLRDGAWVRVVNSTRGSALAEHAEVAASPWRRMRGLLWRPRLAANHGLLIISCRGVHSLGMAYAIDVVHLDRNGVVRCVLHELKPWRIGPLVWRASVVLELPARAAADVAEGDRLALEPLEPGEIPLLRPE